MYPPTDEDNANRGGSSRLVINNIYNIITVDRIEHCDDEKKKQQLYVPIKRIAKLH